MLLAADGARLCLPRGKIEALTLQAADGKVLNLDWQRETGTMRITDDAWVRGKWYRWEALWHGKKASGHFFLADQATLRAWSRVHPQLARHPLAQSALAAHIELAEVLQDPGYAYDAHCLLAQRHGE